jgi:hypothetical protein
MPNTIDFGQADLLLRIINGAATSGPRYGALVGEAMYELDIMNVDAQANADERKDEQLKAQPVTDGPKVLEGGKKPALDLNGKPLSDRPVPQPDLPPGRPV